MLTRSIPIIRNFAPRLAVAALILASGFSGFSEEPGPKSKPATEQKPDAAPEKKNILNFRAYRPSDSIFKTPSMNLPAPTPTPSAPAPRTSRENRELLDREKNWIFVLPGDAKKSDSAEDVFGVGDTFDGENSKSVVAKFLENKSATGAKPSSPGVNGFDRGPLTGSPVFGLGNQKQNGLGTLGSPGARPDNLFGTSATELSLSERWEELHSPRAEKIREEKRLRMNEFENLFGSQNIASGNGNPLQNNFGLQSANSPSRSSEPDFFNRNLPSAPNAFNNPARPFLGAGSPTVPNINTRVFGPSAAPAPAPEPERRAPPPAILPIPKRRF